VVIQGSCRHFHEIILDCRIEVKYPLLAGIKNHLVCLAAFLRDEHQDITFNFTGTRQPVIFSNFLFLKYLFLFLGYGGQVSHLGVNIELFKKSGLNFYLALSTDLVGSAWGFNIHTQFMRCSEEGFSFLNLAPASRRLKYNIILHLSITS